MKTVKVSKILRILEKDGWTLDRQKGSHRQFVHPTKKGTVTINGGKSDSHSTFRVSALSDLGKSLGRSLSGMY